MTTCLGSFENPKPEVWGGFHLKLLQCSNCSASQCVFVSPLGFEPLWPLHAVQSSNIQAKVNISLISPLVNTASSEEGWVMHEWKWNCVSNQLVDIFSTIMSRYSEERVRVHRFCKQNQLGELKKQEQAAPVPTSFITWHMWCMWCTQLCIDQFLSLHSLVFQPHDILGHMICVCSTKNYASRTCPKSLSKLKCHKGIVWICKLFAPFVLLNLHWVPKRSHSGAFLATQAWSRST